MIWIGRAEKNYERKGRRMMDGGADTSSDSICRGGNLPPQRREVLWQSWGGKSLNGQHWVVVIMGLTSIMTEKNFGDKQKPTEDIRIGSYELVWDEIWNSKKKRDPPLLPGIQEPVESIPANLRRIKNYYMNSYTGSIATQERVARHTRKIKIPSPNQETYKFRWRTYLLIRLW
mgnify:CR=1 FL=1